MLSLRRFWGVAAVAAALAATTLATTTQSGADAAGTTKAGGSHQTTLHIHVGGCPTCKVQLQQALTGRRHVWQSKKKKLNSHGVVTFEVAPGRTAGMSFVVEAPWAKGTDAVPNAVTAYGEHAIGAVVSGRAVRSFHRATGCWAGPNQAGTKTLHFEVERVKTTSPTGRKIVTPLVFSTHTLPYLRPFTRTFHGSIGNQDAYYCTVR
ncbi:MAG TPA: hypothetical protein VHW64_04295 [Nocardioides sp.]|jgi:hypothetical protein|uniref:hypothetical protein n=1 Tax=Nocardioides sp. TaxID=35761 RepID=UPI002E368699|nr:hypothetical protein [Nocardioides sp.]HEX3929897.1 hypothetical protein [Nocardioides sp.]